MNVKRCGRCRFCKDLPKYGGPGRYKQKCLIKQCLRLSRILYSKESIESDNLVIRKEFAEEFVALGLNVPQVSHLMLPKDDEEESHATGVGRNAEGQ